ncbi:MAG: WD40 repeat domain-containing protein, partial [Planctomycetota bacterium]
ISPDSAPSFDASGRRLVVPTEGEITTLDAGTGEVLLRHEESRMPQHVALHPGGEGLACSVASRGGADTLWYLRLSSSGRTMAARRYVASCYAMAFAPDGKWIAAASRLRVLLLSPETMEIDRALHGFPGRVTAVAFSPDGRSLAAAGYRVARLFDLSGSVAPRSFPVKGRPTSVEFSGDGSRLAVGSTAEVRSYDLGPNDPRVLRGHATWVYNVAFSPDGTRLASSDFDGGAIVWNPVTGERAATCMEAGARSVLQFSADGTQLLLGSRRGTKPCRTWNPVTGRKGTAEPGDPSRTGLHDHYEETLGYQECRQVHGRDERVRLEHEGKWPVRVVVNGQVSLRLGAGRPGRPQAIALSPDEKRAVTGHTDGTVALWDLSTGRELARGGGHTGTVFALEFHPDGSRVVSGGNDGLMIVRNPSDLLPLVSLRGHESYVHDLDFRPDGKMLASASGDGTVRVWDATPHLERRPTSNR